MEFQLQRLAALALIDEKLDELQEDFGDLPMKVQDKEKKVSVLLNTVEETKGILLNVKKFCTTAQLTLKELKDKEESFGKQQFLVKNNKEFDAITSEVNHVKTEYERLENQLRTETVKSENLDRILKDQDLDYQTEKEELVTLEKEMRELASSQDEEVKELYIKRDKIFGTIEQNITVEYNRIRAFHRNAAVQVKRNSCSGCYSSIPPQLLVEIRKTENLDSPRHCEHCGRILIPEEFVIDDSLIESI
ncbi:MAG: C4-type zinc ribbon domain-containing protein [Candidatus Kapabacteria bacterium]|nr:C4-type zinc ribbon domain-containing protein [Candidatus Kapabacteria bacterium]